MALVLKGIFSETKYVCKLTYQVSSLYHNSNEFQTGGWGRGDFTPSHLKTSPQWAFIQAFLSTAIFPQVSVSLLFAQFSVSVGWPYGRHQREKFLNLNLQIAVKCIFHGFFLEFQSFIASFEEKLTRKIHTTFLYECLEVS